MTSIRKLEKLFLALILGLIAPILGLLVFWWAGLPFLPEKWLAVAALVGPVLGIVLDIFFLKRVLHVVYKLDIRLWMAIHLFYSAGVFGFFMGVPVVNVLLAIPAGFVVGGKLVADQADGVRVRKAAQGTAWFTTIVFFLVCISSATLALVDPSTPANLQGMFGLKFTVTHGMVVGLILVGGSLLLVVNWVLTAAAVRFSHTLMQRK